MKNNLRCAGNSHLISILRHLGLLILLAGAYNPLHAQTIQQPVSLARFDGLTSGPFAVGFRVLYRFDRSRTWKTKRQAAPNSVPDVNGRPIRITLWYPAQEDGSRPRMKYGDYVQLPAPPEFKEAADILDSRDSLIASLSVPKENLSAALSAPVSAHMDAAAAPGRFPLLIHFPGLNDVQALNAFVMAEFLASHGHAVATVSLLGVSDVDTDQHRTPLGLETAVRDAEFAWSVLRDQPMVDATRLAVSGHSLGAIEAVLFAMRNADTTSVVGLDGTYGFSGATKVLTGFYSYEPKKMTAAMMDLRKDKNQQQTVLDLSALQDFHFSDRTLVTLDHMHHSDFTSFAVVGFLFHYPDTYVRAAGEHDWNRETGLRGYLSSCEILKDFLDEQLQPNSTARKLQAAIASAPSGTYEHVAAAEPPPAPAEIVDLMEKRGYESGVALVDRYRRTLPMDWTINESTFNSLGYQLLGEKKAADAILAFRLNTYAHPTSANAQDSLGDGYLAAGETSSAISAYQRAGELAADDPFIDPAGKKSFADDENQKAARLRATNNSH